MSHRRERYVLIAAIVVVSIIGSIASVYTYQHTAKTLNESLLRSATAVAYALNESDIASLTGSLADLDNPNYQRLKERLVRIRSTNPDIRFAYLTGYRDNQPLILVDSEPTDSADYSPPGQVYDEGSSAFRTPFTTLDRTPRIDDIYTDRWGTWLTAVTPILDAQTGTVLALMGMDMAATNYYRTVLFYTSFPVGVTLFFILMLVIAFYVHKRERDLLEFKAEIVSIASHELRTPLTGIAWIAEGLLKDPGQLPQASINDIRLIETQSRELLLTVGDFLDLTAIEHTPKALLTKQIIHAATLANELSESFQVALPEKRLALVIDPSITTSISFSGDPVRIKRMFANLISNAIKYSQPGGTITLGCKIGATTITFWVKDGGIGIAEEDRARIFNGYYRAENAQKATENGTGLGLRYVEQVALLHSGRVWVESTLNKGSTFYVELPA